MKLINYYLTLVFTFCVSTFYAQDFTFYHYGLEDGLSQETIRGILKDSNGFLWLGTQDGLNRFDGNSFKVYKHTISDTLSIADNFINTLIENDDKTIWIATGNKGVCYYNTSTDTFNTTSFNSGNCSSLTKDTSGNIYATFLDKGIVKFEKKGTRYKAKTLFKNAQTFTASAFIDNTLYIGTKSGVIFTLDDSNANNSAIKLPNCSVNVIVEQGDNIWLGTSLGLFVYNKNSKETVAVDLEVYNKQLTEKLAIEAIKIKDNQFYIGTDNGLIILNEFNPSLNNFKSVTNYYGDKDNSNSITSNRVYDIFLDTDLLWIGTNNLDVASLKPPVFKTINNNSKIGLSNNHVFSILKHKDYTFIGTRNGLQCIDNTGKVIVITRENSSQALAYSVIRGMAIDAENNLWLATTKGVSVINLQNFDPKSPKIVSMYYNKDDPNSLSNNKTRNIFKDHANNIWITTYGGGLNLFTGDLTNNEITFKSYTSDAGSNSISSDFIFNISQDAQNNYWITSEKGLNKLEFKNSNFNKPQFTVYQNEEGNPNSLKHNTTLHTHHDKNGTLWVATQNGLHKFNPEDESFKNYNQSHGLTNNYIYSILEDNSGFLWVSTNQGLFKFDKTTERFSNFTTKDGVQSSEFNLGAHYNDTLNNLLYFGGVNGYNEFNPNATTQLDKEGLLTFTSLTIKDKEINPIVSPNILSTSLKDAKEIKLSHLDFPCYIQFSDLDLRPTKNNQFVYSLNDNEWNNLRDVREIQLLDLPKGRHTLKIQGKSRNSLWSKQPLELTINVTPPWYKSNLAYLLYLVSCLSLCYAFFRLSLQHQLAGQEAKRLTDLDTLKSQFITNITHEFRTPLTLILGYIGTLKEAFSTNTDAKKPIKSIEQSSNNLLHLVNEMLDLSKLEKGKLQLNESHKDIVPFAKYIVNSFSSLAESNNISLSFSATKDVLMMDFDTEKMRQIISNLLSNAIKFSNANKTVTVVIEQKNNHAVLTVKDEGEGITEHDIIHIFDRFYQSNQTTNKTRGTGIGLALTKELVLLMEGSITVNSKINKGTQFTLKFPIKSNAEASVLDREPEFNIPQKGANINLQHQKIDNDLNTILLVEDNPEIANYIASCLDMHYNVIFAVNGKEGFALAEKTIPDVILTDVMMPIMNGYELTQQLQETKTTNHIPIIMLTAKAQQEDKLEGLKSGADAYLIKPFQKEELLLRIETLITKRKHLQAHYRLEKIIKIEKTALKKDKNLEFLDAVIQNIHLNLENSDYNASRLASDIYMSESQLYRKLKAITDKSTAIFIRSVRLEKAKELLETTDLSISEIAYASGFSNPNWFGKIFKETYQITPTSLRK